ncbi:MAG: hypothetical protein KDH89_04180 [Anaerolineae bacterium]|nr:hypothetical protein [Anaerolineae bacterium]
MGSNMPAATPNPLMWSEPFLPDDPPVPDPLWALEQRLWTADLPRRYVDQFSQPGDIILDPFASQPAFIRHASPSRRRVVVNNAIPASLLAAMTGADPPPPQAVDGAFTRIADAPRRGQTLADHLRSLYNTMCPNCAGTATATAFIWDRTTGEPQQKRYMCPHCQQSGQAPVDMDDLSRLAGLEIRGAAYWGLLSRLVAPGDALTAKARTLIDLYVPRTLLAVNEMITATDQRIRDAAEQQAARAIILHVLQQTSTLHTLDQPEEPGQARTASVLDPPRRFVEHNAWHAFEHAHRTLRERPSHPVLWANNFVALRGPSGEGRVAAESLNVPDLAEQLMPGSVALILTEPPSFDPGAYLLGFLWTGWLFGREAASHSKAALSIERWSWDWYARAMGTALGGLRPLVRADGRMVLAFQDRSTRRVVALIAAAARAGWRLVAQATQASAVEAGHTTWRLVFAPDQSLDEAQAPDASVSLQTSFQAAAVELLSLRAEPTPWPLIVTAGVARWAEEGLLSPAGAPPESLRRPVSTLVEQAWLALSPDLPPPGLIPFTPGGRERIQWRLEEMAASAPLADRVEQFIAERLREGDQSAADIHSAVYGAFSGLETPDAELVGACLSSYAVNVEGGWWLRSEDQPHRRSRDLSEMLLRLHNLGHALGFQVWIATALQAAAQGLVPLSHGGPQHPAQWSPASVVWHDEGNPQFAFALTGETALHPWLAGAPGPLEFLPRYVVLPGGRAELLDFKLRRTPFWREQLAWSGWEFIKFRHIRRLAAMPDLTLASFRARVGMDPVVTLPGRQLALFETEDGANHDLA